MAIKLVEKMKKASIVRIKLLKRLLIRIKFRKIVMTIRNKIIKSTVKLQKF